MEIVKVESDGQVKQTAEMAAEIWREHFAGIISAAQIEYMLEKYQSYGAMLKQINEENYIYYLLRGQDGFFYGYFAVAPKKDGLFLSKIYIKKTARGKGYARKAVEFMKNFAKNAKLPNIHLTVNRNNTETVNIYKKMDFKIVKEADTDIGNGFFMNDYIMSLEV